MAVGTKTDFVIYHEEFFGGMNEVLQQNTDVFNAASRGGIRFVTRALKGDYEKESFMKEITGLIARRDPTSTSTVSDLNMTQGEMVGVKINRRIGPVKGTLDEWKKIGEDPSLFSFLLGQQWGKAASVEYVNTAIAALVAALSAQTALVTDKTAASPTTMTHAWLAAALSKFGDASNRIVCWVMHSTPWFDLMGSAISGNITNVADIAVKEATNFSLGRPTIVIDSPSLVVQGTPDEYVTLGLTDMAAVLTQSETETIESQIVTGEENLSRRIQGEYAYNLRLKGFTWDTGTGGINPTDGAIATAGNWDKVATDDKNLAGVYLITK